MEYKYQHFGKCLFNPMERDLMERYPVLKNLSMRVNLMKYVIVLYDPNSPFILQHRDIRIRKQMAAQFAGFDIVLESEMLNDMYLLKNDETREVVVRFLKKFAFPREWFMICANEHTFYEYGERMMEPITKSAEVKDKDEMTAISIKSKLSQDMEVINERIEKGYKKMFGDDTEIDIPGVIGRTTAESMSGNV